jgi:NADH dehydrogenase [ubiquinone] 1 alpha subcomplex assembly factor 7
MTRDTFGARGDFVTAPEISQMFGEMIGVWIASAWTAMGAPSQFNLVELGPGRGTLMQDALRAMRAAPGLLDATRVHLVEISPALRDKQRATLADVAPPVAWHGDLASVPDGPLIVVANEFFDALPIRQFVRQDEAWREKRISRLADDKLCYIWAHKPALDLPRDAPDGAIFETSPASFEIVAAIADRLFRHPGAALVIDYGHASPGFGDTLQAMRAHKFEPPLKSPGEADLTAHVDFSALIDAARAAGVATQGAATQGAFLRARGSETRARQLGARASVEQKLAIAAALARLTDQSAPKAMGALFKAIALRSNDLPPMPGFDGEAPAT